MIDRVDLALSVASLHRQMTLKRILHRRRVQHLAILKLHAGAQVDDQCPVIGPLVAGGELRYDFQLLVDVEQLVAQPGKHDAPDIGGCQRRI